MKKKLINNILVTIIILVQFVYLLMFYFKNQLYLDTPTTSISKSVFEKLQTYDKVANIMGILLPCIIVFYCGYVLFKIKEKQIITHSLVIMSILFIVSVIFYLMFLNNIYYDILICPLTSIGLLIIILIVTLFRIRKCVF